MPPASAGTGPSDPSSRTRRYPVLGRFGTPAALVVTVAGCCAFIWVADPTMPGGLVPVCPTKALLGIDCPVCGSARMVYSLLHGDTVAALHANALGVLAVVLLAVSGLSWAVHGVTGRWMLRWDRYRWTPLLALLAGLAWLVIRNLPWAPFTGLHV